MDEEKILEARGLAVLHWMAARKLRKENNNEAAEYHNAYRRGIIECMSLLTGIDYLVLEDNVLDLVNRAEARSGAHRKTNLNTGCD